VAALIGEVSTRELAAMRAAADQAPGPLSALAACLATFAARALQARRLIWAVSGEPVEPAIDPLRVDFRQALTEELEARITAAVAAGHLPEQEARIAAPAILGALLQGLIGPLAPVHDGDGPAQRAAVQAVTLLALRALGMVDARARGLVAQCALPPAQKAS
jgi:AcrR family transcriptional regulator